MHQSTSGWYAAQVGPEDHVICALSGGVDSTVAATLVHKVLGDRLHCVFVDNGLLRYKVCPCIAACLRTPEPLPPVISQLHDQLTPLHAMRSVVNSMLLHAIKLVGQHLTNLGCSDACKVFTQRPQSRPAEAHAQSARKAHKYMSAMTSKLQTMLA